MVKVLEAVPNFSEGRDATKVRALVDVVATAGAEVLDWSADPDHHRSVLTFVGDPATVEEASVRAACYAVEALDLRDHQGVHPRVGVLDVLPFVPLRGLSMQDAVASARRVGKRIADLGVPVFLYGRASSPPGRALADLRRGGFESLVGGFPPDRQPDFAPPGTHAAHPTAGATCVGARRVLLAWNVFVDGVDLEDARAVARSVRERGGGFPGVRALALHLERQGRTQISMNLEDPERTSPMAVFEAIEAAVLERGGRVTETQVVGMIPDALVLRAAADRLDLLDLMPARLLSQRVSSYVTSRLEQDAGALVRALDRAGPAVPEEIREMALRLTGATRGRDTPDEES